MYRPPPHVRPNGGGGPGSGGLRPPNYFPQNPNFPFPDNPQYHHQRPPTISQPYFQNPNFSQTHNPYLQPPSLPHPNPSPSPHAMLERVENAVAKVHRDLVTAGESVSAWKVSQSAIVSLKVDSWNSLGFKLQDVPSLRRLISTEGKVSAFIHCFVGARRITSLYDLDVAICKNEGIKRFEELGLGPLSSHPLAKHYFSVPSDSMEVFKITSEDIIAALQTFMDKCKKLTISAEEFLGFLAEQKSVSGKEKLGVRIQSLGLHVSYIREAKKAEKTILSKSLEVTQHDIGKSRGRKERDSSQPPSMILEKQVLDQRFDYISDRIKSFHSGWNVSSGKHIGFDSCSDDDCDDTEDDDVDGGGEDINICPYQSSSHDKDNGQRVSSCPYPSTAEEMIRLGLKFETGEKVSSSNDKIMETGDKKSSGKKRKFRGKNDNGTWKLLRKGQVVDLEDKNKLRDLCLTSGNMEKFITTWKEVCREHSAAEVLVMMVNFYEATIKRRKKIRRAFLSNPGLGLLNVAVTSIKRGMLDSLYDTFQAFGEHGLISPGSTSSAEMIEIEPSFKEDSVSNTNKDIDECGYSVTADDIIKKVAQFFELDHLMERERSLSFGKKYASLKKFQDCEKWLATQFSVKEFSSLGHGNFFGFLEQHASLLPELYTFLNGVLCEPPNTEVSMLHQQLGVLLSQAESNLMDKGDISKSDFSVLLKRQFPTISFHIVGNESEKWFVDLIRSKKDSDKSNCVLFSATLLGKRWTGNLVLSNEKLPSVAAGMKTEVDQQPCHYGTISSKDAIECLLKAPMLSDLLSWSHWDLLYAPSLGPLSDWLLNEVNVKELICIATIDGKLIRIDHSATVDEFLEAMIQCSSFQVALKLLSLLSLYRGTSNAPLSLLKCYAQRAIDVIIRNSIDSLEVSTTGENLMHKCASKGQVILDKDSNFDPLGTSEASSQGSKLSESLCRINRAVTFVSRFILECLGYLPSEFRSFSSEILVSGLRSVAKDAPAIILHECTQTDQRLMLHDIGLSLGITEWIEDYHEFSSTAAIDLFTSSKTLHTTSHSLYSAAASSGMNMKQTPDIPEKPISDNHTIPVIIVADALPTNGNHESFDGVNSRTNGATLDGGHDKAFDEICKSQLLTEVTSGNSGISEDRVVQDANLIVESIRHEEFGLDPSLNYTESCLLKKQHARLGRALHCLSQELYSQDSHLLLELVQNADDNVYPGNVDPMLVFILQETGIVVLNNEQGFSAQNIRALCDIGNSTKKGSRAGYIGHKGIGFKSVFRVTDAPEIHSNGFHVKFDITEGQIGFVLPTVIPPCDIDMLTQLLSDKNDQRDGNPWSTCILLPFRSKCREGTGMSSIISIFSDLHPSLLLFLHRLRCIKFMNMLNETLVIMRREILGNGIVKVSHGPETMSWLVVSKKLQASMIRPDVKTTEISMAFTLQESENGEYKPHLSQQPVFAFLPLRNYGLKFILQGDFVLPSSREEVDGNSAWNQWLLSEFPSLFVSAEKSFCHLPCFQKNPGKAVTAYMSFVPLVGEVHGFFSHLPHMIVSKLRMSNCLLLDGPDLTWVLPCRVLRGWNEQARILLSDSLLQKHLGLGYLSKDVKLSDALSKALGIQDYGPRVLIEVMSSLCRTNDGIQSLGLDWLSSWLATLYSTLSAHSSGYHSLNAGLEYDLINGLRKIPFIPLSDGSYSSVADGPIWLPCDALSIGFEGKHSPKNFPSLYAKLRTVNPLLFAAASTNTYNGEEASRDNLIYMLHKIGVQQSSAHEVIKSHILVSLSEDKHIDDDRSLMIEYLSFVMLHLQYDCASCRSEKEDIMSELRKKSVILTNHGYKCPIDEPIHFGKEYKNPVDVDKLIDMVDVKWLEVDVTYLKHPSTQSLPFGLTKWRNFFQELGVTDFVQVTFINKNVSDVLNTVSGRMFDGDLILSGSFVNDWESPELVNLLSTFLAKKFREKCIYLLQVLDKMWDDCYSAKARSYIISKASDDKRPIESSFMKSIRDFEWIASSMDQELHHSSDLFYDCVEVRSVLGNLAPYAVPQVTNKLLLKDIGFKTEVSLDDALTILHTWRMSKDPFMASIVQMSKFYTFISDGLTTSKVKITEGFTSSSFIFIPFLSTSRYNDVVSGIFLCPKEVYWHDPTGCGDRTKELILQCPSTDKTNCLPCKALATVYPSLRDFFVNVCGVHDIPPFGSYLQMLLQLSSVALPSQAAHVVYRVFLRWADDLKSGLVKPEEILDLKEDLLKLENTVLPTLQDKWISLHPSFGLTCWSDDEELKQQFKHSASINFLHFGELCKEEKELLSGKIATLMHNIGVPALSEVVSREAIFYGTEDNREKASLINWVLPYAQRYLYKLYPDVYLNLKQLGFEKLTQMQVVVVNNLFYKHYLKGRGSTSKKRFECSCLLQGNILYITRSSDSHSIFLELSRIFFNGSAELHLANFLHIVTTMAESGSTNEQTESFIINNQKVPKLPDDEPVWCLSSMLELPKVESPQPILASPMNIEQNTSTSQRRPGICPNWPPTDWKTAPDFSYARRNQPLTRPLVVPYSCSQNESSKPLDTGTHIEVLPVPVEIDGDWIVEEGLTSATTLVLQNSVMPNNQPHSGGCLDSLDSLISSSSEPNRDLAVSMVPGPGRDRLCGQTPDENQSRKTGKLGEVIAYKYFVDKLGSGNVKWVNEETETGLPYDLITGEEEGSWEYIEVKATRYANKDWFPITTREWQFAAERGDSYSIAHVVLLGPKKASITVLKNPLRLCQQKALHLAVLMSMQHGAMLYRGELEPMVATVFSSSSEG